MTVVDDEQRRFLDALRGVDAPPATLLQHLARVAADDSTHWDVALPPMPPLPTGGIDPWLLGRAREVLHTPDHRTALGAWFTPPDLARRLVAAVETEGPSTVIDPACGGGAFLLAAHERWPTAHLAGRDIDHLAVTVTRAALDLAGCTDHHLQAADGLGPSARRYDVVIGNPPFRSQLGSATARDADRRSTVRERFGSAAHRYVDDAALFLLHTARDLLAPGGVAVLVLPEALLATADAAAIRSEVSDRCAVEVVWRDHDGVFPGVPTCAVRLVRTGPTSSGERSRTRDWAAMLADGVPEPGPLHHLPTLGSIATATADFRDAYYLVADHVQEQDDPACEGHPIVPVGLIDPANLQWGTVPVRFAKRRWDRPVAVGLPRPFLESRLGPKVMLATQTRVLEALVDIDGDLLPTTPVITLRTDRPWHVGAALTSPVLTAVAARRHAGAARSRDALKLSARQVLSLPLPPEGAEWDEAADAYRLAHDEDDPDRRRQLLHRCGDHVLAAFGVTGADGGALRDWWSSRLPSR